MSSDLYLPIEERRNIIRDYARLHGTRIFVETGTADGSTTAALVPDFDTLLTVEIDLGLYNAARTQFSGNHKVSCFLGDSATVLPNIVGALGGPALFWLDGHYCGGATRGDVDSPVIDELVSAVTAPKGSVILIDDARIFGGGPEFGLEGYTGYPQLAWVEHFANEHGLRYLLKDDIIRLTPPI